MADVDRMLEEMEYNDFARLAATRPKVLYGWGAEVREGVAVCLAEGCGHTWTVEDGLDAATHECPGGAAGKETGG
jgi:hypothetical protein